jgi:hypothetical protein
MRIATGEADESETTEDGKNKAAVALGRIGGRARAASLTKTKRKASLRPPPEHAGGDTDGNIAYAITSAWTDVTTGNACS